MKANIIVATVALTVLLGLASPRQAAQETSRVQKGQLKTVVMEFDGSFEPEQIHIVRPRFEIHEGDLVITRVKEHGSRALIKENLIEFEPKSLQELERWLKNEQAAAIASRDRLETELRLAGEDEALALERARREKLDADLRAQTFDNFESPLTEKQLDLEIQRAKDALDEKLEEKKQLEQMYKGDQVTNQTVEVVQKRTDRAIARAQKDLEVAQDRARIVKQRDLPIQKEQLLLAQKAAFRKIDSIQRLSDSLGRQRTTDFNRAKQKHDQLADQVANLGEDIKGLSLNAGNFEGIVYYGSLQNGDWTGTNELLGVLRPGAKVKPSQVALTVCSYALKVRIEVPERELQNYAAGLTATVLPVGFSEDTLKGTTGERSPIAVRQDESGRTFRGEVRLDVQFGKQEKFAAGMRCRVKVSANIVAPHEALLVPATAVRFHGARVVCFVKSGDAWGTREVRIGRSDGARVEVVEGLNAGDEVLTYPPMK